MNPRRKFFYLSFTGLLTSLAMTACYWQTNKYFISKSHWKTISKQLSSINPTNLSKLSENQKNNLYAFKYVQIDGKLSEEYKIVTRSKGMRTGYLVLRKIQFENDGEIDVNKDNGNKKCNQMIALQGWCPQNYQINQQNSKNKLINQQTNKTNTSQLSPTKKYKGILRKKQHTDYLHKKMKQSDLQKFNMNTWIHLQKYLKQFGIEQNSLNKNFYFQILKPINQQTSQHSQFPQKQQYPYQYSVDNFELPYLTPEKHQGYATFWGMASLVGWFAIIKVFRMK